MTLLELMVALTVLAVAIVGMLSGIAFNIKHNELNRRRSVSLHAMQQKMEEIQSAAADNFSTVYGTYNNENFSVTGLTAPTSDSDGQPGKVTIDNTDPALLDVTVTINYQSSAGDQSMNTGTLMVDK
jgi:type II secretory pathway pseudopilin PulG